MKRILTFLTFLFLLTSCSEDENTLKTSDLNVVIEHNFDGQEITFSGEKYNNEAGNEISLERVRYLISNIRLQRNDGSEIIAENLYAYIDPQKGRNSFVIPELPRYDYVGIKFDIGLDSAISHQDPNLWPADHPLSLIQHNLHWGWIDGYIFCSLEGRIFNGDLSQSFVYHLGFNRNLRTISISTEIDKNSSLLNIEFNVAEMLRGPNFIDMTNEVFVSHSTGDNGLSDRLMDNILNAFNPIQE